MKCSIVCVISQWCDDGLSKVCTTESADCVQRKQPNCVTGGEKANSVADGGSSRPEIFNIASPISKKRIPKTRSVADIQKMFQSRLGDPRDQLRGHTQLIQTNLKVFPKIFKVTTHNLCLGVRNYRNFVPQT